MQAASLKAAMMIVTDGVPSAERTLRLRRDANSAQRTG